MEQPTQNKLTLPGAIIIAGTLIAMAIIFKWTPSQGLDGMSASQKSVVNTATAILIDGGHILPIETEKKMLAELTANGSIDPSKLPQVTELNLLWAFGLANKNPILENGPIMDLRYGGPINMASVGGWIVTNSSVMDHFNKHSLATLTDEQQQLVEKIAKGIYRPCCGNSTHFPDCNHGMAMLGLLEFLASSGATEENMWNVAIKANMIWFPDAYQMIGQYLTENGIDMKKIKPQEILGFEYSSAEGYAKISSQVKQPIQRQSSGGCNVNSGKPVEQPKQQPSCGV